ncbi:hypothetical protein WR25_08668 [Diploscapter pachys]|uniref:Uncharacterized protein n=1 Tax=Diploscapter pachys TaxID=2018661 RepID=A0A2A2LNU9_9BILA|nr:hypothetical protein WR25_08668 [Diploscapter pachys]
MPFPVTGATLEVPNTATIDVHAVGIEIYDANDMPLIDFEHGPQKEYSVTLGQYRSKMTIYDMRQMGLNADGEDMVMALFDLTLTFKRGGKMVDFCIKLKECGYTEPTHGSSSGAQEYVDSSLPHSQFPPHRAKQGFNSLECHE